MVVEWPWHEVSQLMAEGKLVIGDGYRAKNEELASSGLPFARAGNINDGFRFDDADHFPEESLARVGNKVSQPGDVVFTSKGTVGRFAFVRATTPRFVYSPQLCFWRSLDHEAIDPQFLYYWMFGREFFVQFKGVAGQTDMAEYVSLTDQRRMHITIPPLPEQRAIAHLLGTLDDKIELNRRMNETLEAMARALFKSWFVDFDPMRAKAKGRDPGLPKSIADIFPDRFEDSELGEIPSGWGVGRFGDVVEQLRDQENPLSATDAQFSHYSIPAFDEGQWPKTELGESIKSLKSRVPLGVILLSKLNPEIERVWLVDIRSGERAVCSTEFLVLRARSPFTRSYAYCLARSPVFRQQIESLVTGTSKSHQRAQVDAILNLGVFVPPSPIVEAFERSASSLLTRTLGGRRESSNLTALRDALLPKLISGELRVKDAELFIGRAV